MGKIIRSVFHWSWSAFKWTCTVTLCMLYLILLLNQVLTYFFSLIILIVSSVFYIVKIKEWQTGTNYSINFAVDQMLKVFKASFVLDLNQRFCLSIGEALKASSSGMLSPAWKLALSARLRIIWNVVPWNKKKW